MTSDRSPRRWLGPASIALALVMAGCASIKNTPAQDEAWTRWTACRTQILGPDVRTMQLDGRITFWANGPTDGQAMLDCLAQAGKNGPALPAAIYEIRPKGGA